MPNSFTPGPWFVEDNDRAISSNAATDIALVNMANIRYGWDGPDFLTASHRAANAHLIAAAPELLEQLQDVLARIEKSEEWWMDCPDRGGFDANAIRSAIAKATGEQA